MDTVAFGSLATEVGKVLVAVTPAGLASTAFDDTAALREGIAARLGLPVVDDPARVEPVLAELREYFDGTRERFGFAVDWRLYSATQQRVLGTLYETVPYGKTVTYGELAELSGTGVPARGIGSIMGSNPIPIVVPCHRVLASTGLGGFSGGEGVPSKRQLLTLEGRLPQGLW
ncbi:methylated-DNA--[protein]-cysteine S-methyltransferase [Amycolatopsis sp. 195334CR]|uniref:methylated-DNA--[protein]-cysteine S-methyltransferase n=1 Tax=Amycolatopsis sp. 195334CR TaxID=2814588 RepID=UPI001A8F26CC|nr:methylated-DNA--[protein]-cysteine S-methyltransferase [Amycolatopsis sp. 195334CR]MBN6036840.1 methylated-DNA--[protein]-cysteine S-methyltransferase [Amycolatopsis sp. 195334CR]